MNSSNGQVYNKIAKGDSRVDSSHTSTPRETLWKDLKTKTFGDFKRTDTRFNRKMEVKFQEFCRYNKAKLK